MSVITVIITSFAVAMDAFAVSMANGITIGKFKLKHAVVTALWFGLFQAIMPVIGWFGCVGIKEFLSGVDHWVAFVLLCAIGGKMIWESFGADSDKGDINPIDARVLFLLSIATSIDALVIGVSLAILDVPILVPAISMGVVTFCMSFIGVWIGGWAGRLCGKWVRILGGLILMVIGLKILLTDLHG